MKKIMAILFVMFLVFSIVPVNGLAQNSVSSVQQMVNALPTISSVDEVGSEGYVTALAQAKEAVYGLAYLSEEEMAKVKEYSKAFQLYLDLLFMEAKARIPQTPTTKENYTQQVIAIKQVESILFEEPLQLMACYTYPNIDDSSPYQTTGLTAFYEVINEYDLALANLLKYVARYSQVERIALNRDEYAYKLSTFPENFTQENVLTYAKDFLDLIYVVEYYRGDYYWINEVDSNLASRYEQLREEFEIAMGIYSDYFMEQIDRSILNLCQREAALGFSALRLQLIEQPAYNALADQIEALAFVNGCRVYSEIEQYQTFQEFAYVLMDESSPYGDINGDLEVNAKDALCVLRCAVGKLQINGTRFTVGDLNGDGDLNARDALLILQYSVEKIQWFPIEEMVFE